MPKTCIITGFGRSGTSLMAGLVAANYMSSGARLASTPDNPRGFFEDPEINRLNEDIMATGIRFTSLRLIHRMFPSTFALRTNGWMASIPQGTKFHLTQSIDERIQQAVRNNPFCLKDPRFCHTFPIWDELIPKPRSVVVLFRNPAVVCTSVKIFFERRNLQYRSDFIYRLWNGAYTRVLSDSRLMETATFVEFEMLFNRAVRDKLGALLNCAISDSFVDASLNRSHENCASPAPKECFETYHNLKALALNSFSENT